MSKSNLTAHVGEPSEMLIGEGANQSVAKIRKIRILENTKVIATLTAADSQEDILAQIDKAGFVPGAQKGDLIPLTRKPMSFAGKAFLGCGGLFALCMVLIIGGCTVGMMGGSGKKHEPTVSDAKYYCEEFVKDKLKAPSTAKFRNQTATGAGRSWTSSGMVEAQNSFDGSVSTRYTCTLTYDSSDESWTGRAQLAE